MAIFIMKILFIRLMIEGLSMSENEYFPDYMSSPGDTLLEILIERGIDNIDLGLPNDVVLGIFNAKILITHDIAIKLEKALGTPFSFWENLETNYRCYINGFAKVGKREGVLDVLASVLDFALRQMPEKFLIIFWKYYFRRERFWIQKRYEVAGFELEWVDHFAHKAYYRVSLKHNLYEEIKMKVRIEGQFQKLPKIKKAYRKSWYYFLDEMDRC